jgi:L-rhamnose isomerase
MIALLEPTELLLEEENNGNYGNRLALMEEFKSLPFGAVWDKYCKDMKVPVGADWIAEVQDYEEKVLVNR